MKNDDTRTNHQKLMNALFHSLYYLPTFDELDGSVVWPYAETVVSSALPGSEYIGYAVDSKLAVGYLIRSEWLSYLSQNAGGERYSSFEKQHEIGRAHV